MTRVEMHLRRTLAVATAVALVLAACNGDDGGEDPVTEDITGQSSEDEPDDPPEGEPDEDDDPTEPEDPTEPDEGPSDDDNGSDEDNGDGGNDPEDFAVPDEIDEEYVQRVMDELMRRDSDVVRELLDEDRERLLRDEEEEQLEAIYGGPLYTSMLRTAVGYLSSEEDRRSQLPPEEFGTRSFDVLELHSAGKDCITVLGWWDVTETSSSPYPEDFHLAFVLNRSMDVDDDLNPTGWRMWDNVGLIDEDDNFIPQEEWSDIDFDGFLDHDCEQAT